MKHFIALDGEGITREDNQHDYVLLASSSNNAIHNLHRDGLSTSQCFDFILSEAKPNNILVGFYTSYDVNMILRDIPKEALARLRVEGMVTWRANDNDKNYRIKYLPNRLLTVSEGFWDNWGDKQKRKWVSIKTAKWWDCSRFFQSSFVSALRSWKIGTTEVDEIERMKGMRSVFIEENMSEITQYCYNECRLLVKLMDKLALLLADCGISITSWYGAGSVASSLMKQNRVQDVLGEQNAEVEPSILAAYYGGRIETFGVGFIRNPSYQYDIRSAYPSAVLSLPNMAGGRWEHNIGDTKQTYSVKHIRWNKTDNSQSFTPFPYRANSHIYWPENGEGWYHGIEVEAATKYSGYHIEVLESWVFKAATRIKPFDWIKEIYALRQFYREQGDERERVLKYPLNSIYGKFAQGNNGKWDPPFQNYYYAGYITAYCRAKIMEAMSYFQPRELLTVATDGIITTRPDSRIKIGEELGDFELKEVEPGLLVIQAGVYATPTEIKRTRGFGAKAMVYAELVKLWHEWKIDAKFEVKETKFIGYGLALNMKTMEHWRRWLPAVKTIRFGGNGTKAPNFYDLTNEEWVRLMPPTNIDTPNEAYNPAAPELLQLKALFEGYEDGDDWGDVGEWSIV